MTALGWRTAWTIARRELSARFRGLRLLIICLFLGVAALSAVGTLTSAITQGLATRGRVMLGGDVELSVWQRPLTAPERAALGAYGTLSEGSRLQAMAAGTGTAAPVELKSVDAHWPLVGRLTLTDGRQVGAPTPGAAWVSEGAAGRLGLAQGGTIAIAGVPMRIAGIIADEPDRLGEGFALGPTVIVPADFPAQAGLTAPGAMYRSKTRLACEHACDAEAIAAALKARFPDAGFEVRTREHAAPGADSFVARMGDFLVLVGLAALMIAGIGIGGGTASFLEARRAGIATLKVLGATSADITRIYALVIGAAALAGSLGGMVAGLCAVPLLAHVLAGGALAGLLPAGTGFVFAPFALARAGLFGLLIALVFAAGPLAEARNFPAMALLRARVDILGRAPRAAWAVSALGVAGVIALAFAGGGQPRTTALFLGGAAALFAVLGALGLAIRLLAARLPRPANPITRLALANLHRPGSQTGQLVTALGFGLASFVTLAVIQTSLDANIASRVPARAPDYFAMDLAPADLARFTATVAGIAPQARIRSVPALRGAILAYGPADHMIRVADLPAIPDDAWALKGERGLTYADDVPPGNVVTEGAWWPHGYVGPPQVSVDAKLADTLGLHIGDQITIGLLGTERSARIASFRRIDWDSFGFNYVLVFSPNTLEDAPHKLAATITLPPEAKAGPTKAHLLRALTTALPQVSVIEVGPLLADARALLGQMGSAILAAASVAVLAGIAVLLGAIAAARATRQYDHIILRLLGASRAQLLSLMLAEFAGLSVVLALVALGLGAALGWLVVVRLFHFAFLPDWVRVAQVLGAGLAMVLGFALAASLPLLRVRPAAALREL